VSWRPVFTLAVAVLVVLGAIAPGGAGDPAEELLGRLPGELHRATSAGRWRTAGATGFYRVIVLRGGYEPVADRLYVQWMQDPDSETPPRVVATASIVEINDAGPFTVSHWLRALGTNRLIITVDASHCYTGQRQQFEIVAAAPGVYSLRARPPRTERHRDEDATSRAAVRGRYSVRITGSR
jgi:hypothetical protein